MDWINADPLKSIDAQINVLTDARRDSVTALIEAEQDVIAAMAGHQTDDEQHARARVVDARACMRVCTAEIDELRTERAQIVPVQRWAEVGS